VLTPVLVWCVRAAPGLAPLASHRRHSLQKRDELGDVVAVTAGQGNGEWDAGGIGDQTSDAVTQVELAKSGDLAASSGARPHPTASAEVVWPDRHALFYAGGA